MDTAADTTHDPRKAADEAAAALTVAEAARELGDSPAAQIVQNAANTNAAEALGRSIATRITASRHADGPNSHSR